MDDRSGLRRTNGIGRRTSHYLRGRLGTAPWCRTLWRYVCGRSALTLVLEVNLYQHDFRHDFVCSRFSTFVTYIPSVVPKARKLVPSCSDRNRSQSVFLPIIFIVGSFHSPNGAQLFTLPNSVRVSVRQPLRITVQSPQTSRRTISAHRNDRLVSEHVDFVLLLLVLVPCGRAVDVPPVLEEASNPKLSHMMLSIPFDAPQPASSHRNHWCEQRRERCSKRARDDHLDHRSSYHAMQEDHSWNVHSHDCLCRAITTRFRRSMLDPRNSSVTTQVNVQKRNTFCTSL